MLHTRSSKLAVVVALAIPLIPAGVAAQLIHFTTIHRTTATAPPAPIFWHLGALDSGITFPFFGGVDSSDVGQTLVATRATVGTEAWQRVNGVLSNGKPDGVSDALFIGVGGPLAGGGSTVPKGCMFGYTNPCQSTIYTYDSPWDPPNGIDLGDHHIDEFRLTVHSLSPSFSWSLEFHGSPGHVPEPSAAALFFVGLIGLPLHRAQ